MAKDKDYEPTPKPAPKPTLASDAPGAGYTSTPVPPEELLTEQEQNVYSEGGNGVGPAPASVESVPVETMEAQGIGPRDPYPTAETPPVADATSKKKKEPDVFGTKEKK